MLHPPIGIRPAIDGRRGGVRESLGEQIMAIARNAKAMIEESGNDDPNPVEDHHGAVHGLPLHVSGLLIPDATDQRR